MRLGDFWRKSAFCRSWHSSLALASSKPREWWASSLAWRANFPASRVTLCYSPWRVKRFAWRTAQWQTTLFRILAILVARDVMSWSLG